jgi:hypothetical protein
MERTTMNTRMIGNQRLEFKPGKNTGPHHNYFWHIETEDKLHPAKENTFGWVTIAKSQDYWTCSRFIDFCEDNYPKNLTVTKIRGLWLAFGAGMTAVVKDPKYTLTDRILVDRVKHLPEPLLQGLASLFKKAIDRRGLN